MVTEDQMYTKELFTFEKKLSFDASKNHFLIIKDDFVIIESHDTAMQAAMMIGRIMRIMVWLHDRTF